MNGSHATSRKAVIGNPKGTFWLYDSQTGFDLTHPPTPMSPTVDNAICIQTKTMPITIDPAKSALVIIDMQNFFLSPALGRSIRSKGLKASQQLLKYAIPAARKAGIRVVWANWGLTDEDIEEMPPAAHRAFGFETVEDRHFSMFLQNRDQQDPSSLRVTNQGTAKVSANGKTIGIEIGSKNPRVYKGFGNQMGPVTLEDGSVVEAGRLLCRDQWNTDLIPELAQAYHRGLRYNPPDIWIHKNRMSSLCGQSTNCTDYLDKEGIKTLFFAGVNTDQCVGGSLTDAFSKGYDCILLNDGSATSSPGSCQEAYEYNAAGTYGFSTGCKDLWEGVRVKGG